MTVGEPTLWAISQQAKTVPNEIWNWVEGITFHYTNHSIIPENYYNNHIYISLSCAFHISFIDYTYILTILTLSLSLCSIINMPLPSIWTTCFWRLHTRVLLLKPILIRFACTCFTHYIHTNYIHLKIQKQFIPCTPNWSYHRISIIIISFAYSFLFLFYI